MTSSRQCSGHSIGWMPSRSPGTGGSGLGLAIVRQLAQANGWTVSLENRAGGGLAAWVTLPDGVQPS